MKSSGTWLRLKIVRRLLYGLRRVRCSTNAYQFCLWQMGYITV
jgi:hypothetical protein